MGLLFSLIISYAGVNDAMEGIRHIMEGLVPEGDPDFHELVQYYSELLQKSSNHGSATDWTKQGGQGYLNLNEDENGKLKSAAIKYYTEDSSSTAILFSTKISSFGQNSVDSIVSNASSANGDCGKNGTERYSTTKTIITNTYESFSVGQRNRSPTGSCENISDPTVISANSFISKDSEEDQNDVKEKLTWHYRPLSPVSPLPEIHFQSYDEAGNKGTEINEDLLRSLDGIKFRPLQRSDPSGRRRSFKKRHSSSSTSSRESRASREEELKMFTSLEEAEFDRMDQKDNVTGFGSTPNLATRSHSRSRSRENSKERKAHESWSVEGSLDSAPDEAEHSTELKPKLKDLPKMDSFVEEKPEESTEKPDEVTDDEIDDFWGNSGD